MNVRSILLLLALLLSGVAIARAGDPPALRAIATTDTDAVHPDDVFDVTLSLQNLSAATEKVRIPECGWDRCWKSSNSRVTWDLWNCDDTAEVTIEIPPHGTYEFPKPLKMFVDEDFKQSRVTFKMGFKTRGFGKIAWSAPISLDVSP